MNKRQERDQRYLEAYEEITLVLRRCKEKYGLTGEENHPQALRFKTLEEKLTTERRLLEEVSLPCRFILEHFSTFMGKPDHTIGFRLGQLEVGRGILNDFSINEWGNVYLIIGNIRLAWRDKDYQYLFYPDKVIMRSCDRSKPEIHLFFNFAFKYSKLLEDFAEIASDSQTLYCHPDLFEGKEE
ncbi:hypothetical protein BR63_16160 [Thermanaerosceptrum fracticalcis]|uniref:Uncharacterized protein n=1 Tax=Thermanaerosceptrum fracticalcis TaxID=1712410 RepID=A0A7G6E6G2_THEFR|nr:hypothetical protein [Thermanaerosceptrum fracticalcis]QNB47666.1 hypothetical protein BR63_16160 [Thermanaerosceptrum fracticalcis]